ncbi:hypothetical protein [Thermofilum pendens]|uniref:Uncharacterized protein n=1 Tax=Thermofilum pendens (strain DSM 2475 / Hrk 5) TaxID=368408 RepID=A1RXK7_THEPD|nr:hypothetical protein [Thermofilum pendens]ABL77937.1 hypothetical protein Tpen_0531 [Thermofilum pendens Hrk 5]
MGEEYMRGNGAAGEEVEKVVREEVWRRAALSLYTTRTEDKRRSRGKKKRGEIHYRGLHDAVTEINWDFTRFAAHALSVVPDEVYPRFYRFIDSDARKYLLLSDDNRPREGSAVTELRGRLQAIVDATEDGLRAERHGRHWRVYVPRENWYVVVSKPARWVVRIPLKGFWTESEFPRVLVNTPSDVLRSLQRGWLLTDVTPPHEGYPYVSFGTTQAWQLPSTLAAFPSDDVRLGVTAGILGSTRLSLQWGVSIYGYEEELGWASGLIGEVKRAEFRRLVEECKELNGDSVALATAFLGDGELEYFLRLRWLYFRVGHEHVYLPTESAVFNARVAVERASEYVAFVGKVTRCAKVRHILFVAYGAPGKRGRKPGQKVGSYQELGLYAPVAGALLNLVMVAVGGKYAYIYARIPVDSAPQGWYQRAVEEGWTVKVVRSRVKSRAHTTREMLYYEIPQSSLFEHAAEDATLWEALYRFAVAKAQAKPVARKLVEELLRIKPAGAQE